MPIEKIELNPFHNDTILRATNHTPLSRKPKRLKNTRTHTTHGMETQKELNFIRGLYSTPELEQKQIMKQDFNDSLLYQPNLTFQPARKLFIPSLTIVKKVKSS